LHEFCEKPLHIIFNTVDYLTGTKAASFDYFDNQLIEAN